MDPILNSTFAKICADFNFVELHVSQNQVCANTLVPRSTTDFIFQRILKYKISLLINSREQLMNKEE